MRGSKYFFRCRTTKLHNYLPSKLDTSVLFQNRRFCGYLVPISADLLFKNRDFQELINEIDEMVHITIIFVFCIKI